MLFTFMNKRIDSFYYSKTRKQVRDDQENLVKSRLVNFAQMELLVVVCRKLARQLIGPVL